MNPNACLDPLELKAYAEGDLSPEPKAAVEVHLDGCADCLGQVSLLFGLAGVPDPDEGELPSVSASTWEKLERLVLANKATRGSRRVRPYLTARPSGSSAWLAAGVLTGITALMVYVASQRSASSPGEAHHGPPRARMEPEDSLPQEREESLRRANADRIRLEAERKQAEERVAALERRRQEAQEAERRAEQDEARRKAQEELARIDAEQKMAQTNLERARADERKVEEDLAGAKERSRPEARKPETTPTIALVDHVEGEVYVIRKDGRVAAKARQAVLASEGLETVGPIAQAGLLYPDGTRIGLAGETTVREILDRGASGRGKNLLVARGAITADVARQPGDRPMILATAHGEARVLGTSFRLVVDPASTRVEVMEGKVRLTRSQDKKSVDLAAGQYAAAGAGVDLVARREVLAWKLELDKPQSLRSRLELGTIVPLPHGPALRSTPAPNGYRYGGIGYWAGNEDVITLLVRKSTCLRFRYFLKEPAPVQFVIKNLTKQENFTFAFEGVAGRWVPVTAFVTDIPVVTEGKRVACDVGDRYGRFTLYVGTADKPADLWVDDFRVVEIER